APNQNVPAMRGRHPQFDADLIALDHIERLGRGRHADRIDDGPARGPAPNATARAATANLLRIALPPPRLSRPSYSRDANRGKRLTRYRGRPQRRPETSARRQPIALKALVAFAVVRENSPGPGFGASWPGLSRPSTWLGARSARKQAAEAKKLHGCGPCNGPCRCRTRSLQRRGVDGRDKPGHDDSGSHRPAEFRR